MKPMLSHTITDTSAVKYPVLVSQKLDGIRCLIMDGEAVSRNLKPIRNEFVQRLIGVPEYYGLDGELIVGDPFAKDCYRVTNSGVMSRDGSPDFIYYVFDRWDLPRSRFADRLAATQSGCRVKRVPHHWAYCEADLLRIEEALLAKGAEGVMVRSLDGTYKYGRSTMKEGTLGKLKRMESSEAEILGVIELQHNMNEAVTNALGHTERSTHKENKVCGGVMGALSVKCFESGAVFQIGTGFTAEDRAWFWSNQDAVVGQIITYNHFPVGRKDLPRHPSYKGMRSIEDM